MMKDFQTYEFNPRVITSKAVAYNVLTSDEWLIMTGATARTFTLPGLDSLKNLTKKFKAYKFTNNGTANLTIDGGTNGVTGGDQTIGGKTTITVRPGLSVILLGKPDATDWEIVFPTPWPAATEHPVLLVATTSGTTAQNLVDADGAPANGNIRSILVIAEDTNAGNMVVKNGTNTVATITKSTTAGALTGATSGGISNAKVTKGNTLTVESSTTNGNATVLVVMALQAYA